MFSDIRLPKRHHALQLFILLLGFIACSSHALAAITEPAAIHVAIMTSKAVEKFYEVLLTSRADKRVFAKYALQYSAIEREMRELVALNKASPVNKNFLKISEVILSDWQRIKNRHKMANTYPDDAASRDKSRLAGLFKELIKGKEVTHKALPRGLINSLASVKKPSKQMPKNLLVGRAIPKAPMAAMPKLGKRKAVQANPKEKRVHENRAEVRQNIVPSVTSGMYKVKLGADSVLKIPGPPGELRVWIGAPEVKTDFGPGMVVSEDKLPAVGRTARITPFAPGFKVDPPESICGQINPRGTSFRFTLYPKSAGIYKVGADIQLFDSIDCSGTPVPETARTLKVQVKVDTAQLIRNHAKELWLIFWQKLLEFWGAFLALFFGVILFLLRKRLKTWFGYKENGD